MMTLLERFEWVLRNRFRRDVSKGGTEWSEAAREFRGVPAKEKKDSYVNTQLSRLRAGEAPSLGLTEMIALGKVAEVDLLWWLTGIGRPEPPAVAAVAARARTAKERAVDALCERVSAQAREWSASELADVPDSFSFDRVSALLDDGWRRHLRATRDDLRIDPQYANLQRAANDYAWLPATLDAVQSFAAYLPGDLSVERWVGVLGWLQSQITGESPGGVEDPMKRQSVDRAQKHRPARRGQALPANPLKPQK